LEEKKMTTIRIQSRRGTAQQWFDEDPTLEAGELGYETDTGKFKIGNGSLTWIYLPYAATKPSDLANTLNDLDTQYIQLSEKGNISGVAELNASSNLLVPGTQIIFEGTANDFETTLSVTNPTSDVTLSLPNATDTIVGRATTDTLTNKTISFASNSLSGTLSQFNEAVSDANLATIEGSETLTNKTLTSPKINEDVAVTATASEINVLDGITATTAELNILDGVTATASELNYVDGVTSAIQTQLDAKAPLSGATFTGAVSGTSLTLSGDLTVNGTTTTINSTTLSVDDKNVVLGDVENPTDTTADGGGITLKGSTDKTFNWVDSTDSWTSSENINLASGKEVKLNGTALKDVAETLTNKTLTSPVINNATGISKSDVGLGNVDNTSDANKPVSTATQTALDAKLSLSGGTMTGAITLSGAPTEASHAATKAYVDNTTAGLNFHAAVHATTSTNITTDYNNGTNGVGATLTAMSNGAIGTIDGHQILINERVLVKAQTDAKQNGIYYVSNAGSAESKWVLTRATDADNSPSGEVAYGDFCFVQAGGSAGYGFIVNTTGTITIGSTDINYVQFNAGQVVIAGTGLTEATPGTISIDTATTADLSTAQTFTNKTLTSPKINEDVAVTATASEINVLDGITATTAELNILDGVTSTASEINILDGATLSTTELNYVSGVTSAIQTQLDAKASLSGATFTGAVSGTSLTLSGDLTVNGTTTNINSTNLVVEDKNIVLADVATPTDTTADGGGITLKGATDKTLNWVDATDAWTSSEDFNLLTGKVYEINGTSVLSGTTLGSGVTGSSLTSVGTITSGTWNGTVIADAYISSAVTRNINSYVADSGSSLTLSSSTHIYKTVNMSNAGAIALTVPSDSADSGFPVGSYVTLRPIGSGGQITVSAGSGATLVATDSQFKTRVQYSQIALEKISANTWLMSGDTTA
jgi:hypothetical protein